MYEIAGLFMQLMLEEQTSSAEQQQYARQWKEQKESQLLHLRKALYTEIGFITQTPESIVDIEDMGVSQDEISEINEWIADILEQSDQITHDELTDDVFEQLHYNIRLFSAALSAEGRLSTTVYDGSIAQIGMLTNDEITAVINFYAVIKSLRSALSVFSESIQNAGILPAEYLSPVHAVEREMAIGNVENLAEVAVDLEPQAVLLEGMSS